MISPCVAFPHDALAQTGNRFPGFHCAVTTQITGRILWYSGTGGAGGDQSFKTGFQKLIVCPRPGVRMETARVKNI